MHFFKRPFAFLVPIFMLGLLLNDFIQWDHWLWIPGVFVLICSLYLALTKKKQLPLFFVTVTGGVLLTGSLLMRTERTTFSMHQNGEVTRSLIGEITEIDDARKFWTRSIFTVTGIVEENSIRPHNEEVVCYVNVPNLELNDKLLIRSKVWTIKNAGNPGEFDTEAYWNNNGIYSQIYIKDGDYKVINKVPVPFYERWRKWIKEQFEDIFSNYLYDEELAIASALVLGDKSLLNDDIRQSFGAAGAMHVLAVSGLHVGIILELLLFLFGRIPRFFTKKRALLISLLIIWAYAMVIGFPPSVVRATLMFTLLSIGRLSSRQTDSVNILFFSAFAMLLVDPLLIYDIGFQLSYLAMLGILILQKPMAATIYVPNKWLRKLWEGTTVGIAAQLFTLPLTLYYFHQFPNYFILTNIGMMIFAGIVLSLGLILLATNWAGFIAKFIAIAFGFSISVMLFFVEWIEGLPGALADGFVLAPWIVIVAYLVLLLLLFFRKRPVILRTGIGIGVALLIYIQFDRYSRMMKEEIMLLNASQLVIAVKDGQTATLFYVCVPSRIDQVKKIGGKYLKNNSTPGKFVGLKYGITTFESPETKLTFERSKLGVLVTRHPDSTQFYVRTSLYSPYLDGMTNFTMNYLPPPIDGVNLRDGAYSMPLND